MAALTPLAAQAAVQIQDPDDVSAKSIDIKSAAVDHFVDSNGDGALAFTVESYEPFGCDALSATRHTGQSLAFLIDFPATSEPLDVRIRIRCNASGEYVWRARNVASDLRLLRDIASRPNDTTLVVSFTVDWFWGANGEAGEVNQWKTVSARWVDSKIAEIDSAPDRGWGDFGVGGSL